MRIISHKSKIKVEEKIEKEPVIEEQVPVFEEPEIEVIPFEEEEIDLDLDWN